MTAAEFRALRQSAHASVKEWAALLACSPGAVKNMECKKPIGKQTALLARLMAYPELWRLLPEIEQYAAQILATADTLSAADH